MKSILAISLLLVVTGVQGAVEYEFRQVTRSEIEDIPSANISGKAVIDGERCRIDFLGGTAFPPGTYMITTNGSRLQTWVNPAKKSYVEVNAAGVATSLATSKITIANKKVELTPMPDHPVIAGLPTDHYRLVLTYDITVPFGQIPLKQGVTTVIDKWTTMAYAGVAQAFLADGAMHTGNPDLDDLIDAENTRVKGFPLKQITEITTTNLTPRPAHSEIEMKQTRTQTREILVTSIQSTPTVSATLFQVPAGFHKADPLRDDTQKAPVHVLSMEPASQ